MAAIGDILVKFVADFAEFTKGVDAGTKQLSGFAEQAAKSGKAVEASFEQLKNVVKGLGVYEVFNQLSEAANKVQESVLKIADGAKALDINTDAFQGLKQAAREAGVGLDQATSMFQRFQQQLQSAASGNKSAIDTFNSLGIKILDSNGKVRDATELFTQFAQRLKSVAPGQRGLIEQALLGTSGTSADKLLAELAGGFDKATEAAMRLGTYIDQSVIEKMKALDERLAVQQDKWNGFWAPIVANTKLTALETVNNLVDAIKTSLEAAKPYESVFDKAIAFLNTSRAAPSALDPSTGLPSDLTDTASIIAGKMGEVKAASVAITDTWKHSLDEINAKESELATKAVAMNERVAEMVRQLGFADARTQDMIVSQRNLYAEIDKNANKARDLANALIDAAAKSGATEYPPPPPVSPADFGRKDWGSPRSPTPISTGSGGGKTDDDNIQAQINRYNKLTEASKKAYDTIEGGANQTIEALKRQITVQEQIDTIAAKLGARYTNADQALKDQLKDQLTAYAAQRDATQHALEVVQAAVETDKKYGDGKVALTKQQKDLNEQLKTGRITQDDYNRATKEGREAIEQTRLAAKRYDDDLGSLAAGFEHAANAYSRSNDMYSLGEQAFNGLTSSMMEGLKALQGQSQKSFGQIAADFANMLAQMALQAAASAAFKAIFGAVASGVTASAAPAGGYSAGVGADGLGWITPRAAGGPVSPGQPYVVGEKGPEYFVPSAAGTIVPMSQSGSGGVTVNVDMSGGGSSGGGDPHQTLEFGRRVKAAVVGVIQNEQRPGGTLYQRRS